MDRCFSPLSLYLYLYLFVICSWSLFCCFGLSIPCRLALHDTRYILTQVLLISLLRAILLIHYITI
ncbi:hypothetical protein BJ912DRAFT_968991 [Pholiota molesta]|nr:hypothetical protein BJ912DRAFT_968991 [Pholiota molesta]